MIRESADGCRVPAMRTQINGPCSGFGLRGRECKRLSTAHSLRLLPDGRGGMAFRCRVDVRESCAGSDRRPGRVTMETTDDGTIPGSRASVAWNIVLHPGGIWRSRPALRRGHPCHFSPGSRLARLATPELHAGIGFAAPGTAPRETPPRETLASLKSATAPQPIAEISKEASALAPSRDLRPPRCVRSWPAAHCLAGWRHGSFSPRDRSRDRRLAGRRHAGLRTLWSRSCPANRSRARGGS